jgi:hypothetical protein
MREAWSYLVRMPVPWIPLGDGLSFEGVATPLSKATRIALPSPPL